MGFTLAEVAFSLAIVAVAVTSTLLLFPVGIRTQTLARYQAYAAAKAVEMVEIAATVANGNGRGDHEAPNPWDIGTGRSAHQNDIEQRLSSYRFGIMPVPEAIAARLASEADEIQRHVASGGQLYYAQPQAATQFRDLAISDFAPAVTQRLVFAVVGHAQVNALAQFPWKNWPYYVPWPSPPLHVAKRNINEYWSDASLPSMPTQAPAGENFPAEVVFTEVGNDPAIAHIIETTVAGEVYGYKPYIQGWNAGDAAARRTACIRYAQTTLWYCAVKGVTDVHFNDPASVVSDFIPGIEPRDQVQAFRFLAHALLALSKHVDVQTGFTIDPIVIDGTTSASLTVTGALAAAVHESSFRLAMRFAASFPYDWSVPRPGNRPIMMDVPLIEYDLFTMPRLRGPIFGSSMHGEQWRPLPASPIAHIGRSMSYTGVEIPAQADFLWSDGDAATPERFWGDRSKVTLTAPFAATERCRQLVFWAVDWQSYSDAEWQPSAAVDAARYPRAAPRRGLDFDDHMSLLSFADWHHFSYRNPEKLLAFRNATIRDRADGASYQATGPAREVVGSDRRLAGDASVSPPDYGVTTAARSAFIGRWGADRNGNGRVDKGPTHPSTILRATTVARFNVYDPRLPILLR